jgi:hypothetical protein
MNTLNSITKTLFTLGIIGITFSSCQKERGNDNCETTMGNIAGSYKLVSLKYKASANSPEQDYTVFFDDCEKDDIIKLMANGTYEHVDAGIICSPDGNYSGTWSLSGNTLTSDGDIGGEVQSFDCSKLVTVVKDMNMPGDRLTFTLQKQ